MYRRGRVAAILTTLVCVVWFVVMHPESVIAGVMITIVTGCVLLIFLPNFKIRWRTHVLFGMLVGMLSTMHIFIVDPTKFGLAQIIPIGLSLIAAIAVELMQGFIHERINDLKSPGYSEESRLRRHPLLR